jgi:hypothetical protein
VPFGDPETLDEALLATPLVARWPGGTVPAGRRVAAPTAPADVARTVLDALGLAPPSAFEGQDLAELAQGVLGPGERPLAATHGGRYSVRWGPYVLLGSHGRELRMCDLSLDPSCVADVRSTSPLALEPLRRWAFDALTSRPNRTARSPAVVNEHVAAALVRWGRGADDRESDDE